MKTVLVVANETLGGAPLLARIKEKAAEDDGIRLVVCVPRTNPRQVNIIYDEAVFDAAQVRIDLARKIMREEGVEAIGEVGDQRQDRRVGPVLRPARAVELEPGAHGRGLRVLAGVGGLTIEPVVPGALRLRRFYVRPSFRRAGVGRNQSSSSSPRTTASNDSCSAERSSRSAGSPVSTASGTQGLRIRVRPIDTLTVAGCGSAGSASPATSASSW